MKLKSSLILIAVLSLSVLAQQQKPANTAGNSDNKPVSTEVAASNRIAASSDEQKQFAEAVGRAEKAKYDADAATARLEAAQARLSALIFRIMAQRKLSPDEYKAVSTPEGELYFEKIQKQ